MSVRKEYVAMQSHVVAICARYTRNAMSSRAPCALTLISGVPCLGTARPIDGRTVNRVKVDEKSLKLSQSFAISLLAVVVRWLL